MTRMNRRLLLKQAAALATMLPMPALVGRTNAQSATLKIGVPTAITGSWALQADQVQKACKLYAKQINAQGGIDGRKIEFRFEDTQGDPATCVRKVREMVERDGIKIIVGVINSSEALAIMPNLKNWDTLYISSINGAGSITAANFVQNAFRSNTSAPMGSRVIALWLANSPKK